MLNVQHYTFHSLNTEQIDRAFELMIVAYGLTEVEIWGADYLRMSKEQFIEVIKSRGIIIAFLDDQLVGSISVYPLPNNKYGFGLLNADFSQSGKGIGASLVKAAERFAHENGAHSMVIEILRPKAFSIPVKEKLKSWYTTIGYGFIETFDFIDYKPYELEKSKDLVNPSVFDVYEKELSE